MSLRVDFEVSEAQAVRAHAHASFPADVDENSQLTLSSVCACAATLPTETMMNSELEAGSKLNVFLSKRCCGHGVFSQQIASYSYWQYSWSMFYWCEEIPCSCWQSVDFGLGKL